MCCSWSKQFFPTSKSSHLTAQEYSAGYLSSASASATRTYDHHQQGHKTQLTGINNRKNYLFQSTQIGGTDKTSAVCKTSSRSIPTEFIAAPSNTPIQRTGMGDVCSQLWHLADKQIHTHFSLQYPQKVQC